MSTEEQRFYIRHIRASKLCMSGARMYFAEREWDWDDFLTNGRPVADLDVERDKYAAMVAERVAQEK